MNCIMYISYSPKERLLLSKIMCLEIIQALDYAEFYDLCIVDYIIDDYAPVEHADKDRLRNIRRILRKRNDVEALLAVSKLNDEDRSALKAILKLYGITQIITVVPYTKRYFCD